MKDLIRRQKYKIGVCVCVWGGIFLRPFCVLFLTWQHHVCVSVGGDSAPHNCHPAHLFLIFLLSHTCLPSAHQAKPHPILKPDCSAAVTSFSSGAQLVWTEFISFKSCHSTSKGEGVSGGRWGLGVSGQERVTECVCRGPTALWCWAAAPGWRAASRSKCTSYPSALPIGSCWCCMMMMRRSSPPTLPMQTQSFGSTLGTAKREKLYGVTNVYLKWNSKTITFRWFYVIYCCFCGE